MMEIRYKHRIPPLLKLALGAIGLWSFTTVSASAQETAQPPPQLPTGTVTLPTTPLQTGLQSPLPAPAGQLPKPDRPLRVSPGMDALVAQLRNTPLTINDVVAIALATNRNLALSGENLLRAQGRTDETRAAFNPTLNATLAYLRLNQGLSANLGGQNVAFVNETQRSIGVAATLPLDIAGLLRAATDQAKFTEVAIRLDINRTRNQLVLDTKTGFYDVLRAKALAEVSNQNLQNTLTRLTDAQARFIAGTVARFDVIRAQTDVLNAQQQKIQADINISLALAALNSTLGININTSLTLNSEGAVETPPGVAPPTDSGGAQTQPPPVNKPPDISNIETSPTIEVKIVSDPLDLGDDFNNLVTEAENTRPEILQGDANIAAARKGIDLARRSILPNFGVSWGLNYTPDAAGFVPQIVAWQAQFQVALPLYDGGVARARGRQARADVSVAETNRRSAVDGVTLEVRQAYLLLLQARDRVAVANQGLAQAQEAFRLARVRYNAGVTGQTGVSPLLELSDSQIALVTAQSNQINALFDYNNSRARVDRAAGRYAYVNNGPGYSSPPPPKLTGKTEGSDKKR